MPENKIINYLIITLLLLNLACQSEDASETTPNTTKPKPEASVNLSTEYKPQNFELPKELSFGIDKNDFLFERFYPVGASNNGVFAYISEPDGEATGFYFFNFIIKDSKSDKILWKYTIDEKDALEGVTLKDIWKDNYPKFHEQLTKYKIMPLKDVKLLHLPTVKAPIFDIKTNIIYSDDKSGWGIQTVNELKFILKKSATEREIFKKDFTDDMIINIKTQGCIPLGHQNYALIYSSERIGYEGPPNTLNIDALVFNLDK